MIPVYLPSKFKLEFKISTTNIINFSVIESLQADDNFCDKLCQNIKIIKRTTVSSRKAALLHFSQLVADISI